MLDTTFHLPMTELERGIDSILQSPMDNGIVKMIVRRPRDDEREVIEVAELDPLQGLVGDNWKSRGSKSTPDGSANPAAQLTLMNARAIALVAQEESRWSLAGDQIFVDLNLSEENLPPGSRLAIGSAVIEVSATPHTGCRKFSARFGLDALKFVNSPKGKELRLRGVNTRIAEGGTIRVGDTIMKV